MSSYLNCYVCKVCDPVCFFMSKTEPEQCPFKGYDECSFEQVSKEKSVETLNKMLEIVNGAAVE